MFRFMIAGALCLAAFGAEPLQAQPRPAVAPGQIPAADTGSVREPQGFQRYAGSIIAGGSFAAFDEQVLVNGPLVRAPDQRDKRGNAVFMPREMRKAEGRRTRLVYVIPQGRSPLEVIRGYQQLVREAGGSTLYECSDGDCGGETRYGALSGGGSTGLIQLAIPGDDVPVGRGNPVGCAVDNSNRTGQRFTTLQLAGDAGFVSVLSYVLGDYNAGSECRTGGWSGRTIAIVNILETKAREQRMEMVSADAMGSSMARDGKVAFYAILFDTARAEIKPESQPQIAEMVAYLRASPQLRVLIVGHTDSQGGLDYNIDLSRRRAASVVAALASQGIAANRLTPQGVGMAAPVSTNDTDEGRARNRRVEMVKQ
ncbi:MAG: OmpA family protein [Beijerinckiaceae bacterium]|jgi:outer membrane protein OmpA-like peptidoglycan-associated protein|nr:OmpA family protein [Beijerinckiaceae bacterium]